MKTSHVSDVSGFALLELVIVIAIISILASIAIPNYARLLKTANAVSCLSVRRDIEMSEMARIALNKQQSHPVAKRDNKTPAKTEQATFGEFFYDLFTKSMPWHISQSWATIDAGSEAAAIDPAHTCPSGGTYLWLVSDPEEEGYPKVGCSIHFGTVPVSTTTEPDFTVPSGDNISTNSDFESIKNAPKPNKWRMIPSSKVDGWDSSTGKIEVWGSGMKGIEAPEGDYFIELDTDKNKKTPDVLSQQVETEAGRVYVVEMLAQARTAGSSDFEVLWNGESVSKITPTLDTWSDYSVKVVGTGDLMTLSIAEVSGQNDGKGALLDSISVVATNETR